MLSLANFTHSIYTNDLPKRNYKPVEEYYVAQGEMNLLLSYLVLMLLRS